MVNSPNVPLWAILVNSQKVALVYKQLGQTFITNKDEIVNTFLVTLLQ